MGSVPSTEATSPRKRPARQLHEDQVYRLDTGQRIEYRNYDSRQWEHGIVTGVRPDMLFLDKF